MFSEIVNFIHRIMIFILNDILPFFIGFILGFTCFKWMLHILFFPNFVIRSIFTLAWFFIFFFFFLYSLSQSHDSFVCSFHRSIRVLAFISRSECKEPTKSPSRVFNLVWFPKKKQQRRSIFIIVSLFRDARLKWQFSLFQFVMSRRTYRRICVSKFGGFESLWFASDASFTSVVVNIMYVDSAFV